MKRLIAVLVLLNSFGLNAFAEEGKTAVSNQIPLAQVQLCQGTEEFGNEGQGMAVAAFINFSSIKNQTSQQLEYQCELAMAFAYEYGNDTGFRLGQMTPYSLYPVHAAKTSCTATEENGEITLTVTKMKKNLINKCKLTPDGL